MSAVYDADVVHGVASLRLIIQLTDKETNLYERLRRARDFVASSVSGEDPLFLRGHYVNSWEALGFHYAVRLPKFSSTKTDALHTVFRIFGELTREAEERAAFKVIES